MTPDTEAGRALLTYLSGRREKRLAFILAAPVVTSEARLRCAAIWNGCRCDRRPHDGDGHVWRNSLDGELVDPALYPASTGGVTADRLDVERLARAIALYTWRDKPNPETYAIRRDGSLWPGDLAEGEWVAAEYTRLSSTGTPTSE